MSEPRKKVILITGCSGGIGRCTAEALAQRGHIVWATARRDESVEELAAWSACHDGRAFTHQLDVTKPDSIAATIQTILGAQGRIDALVNNAGFGQIGAVEEVSLDDWRRQFETNVFGAVAAIQAVLPVMRAQGHGRIVNISSLVAHAPVPFMAAYSASKHALDALTTALRLETAEKGIRVVCIEPGPIATGFRGAAESTDAQAGSRQDDGPYARLRQAFDRHWAGSYRAGTPGPERVAAAICKAVESTRPRPRYRVTLPAKLLPVVIALTPDRLIDFVARRILART